MTARQLGQIAGEKPIEQLTADHIAALADAWRPLKQNTRRNKLTILLRLLNHLNRNDLRSAVPRRPPNQLRTVIATPEEMNRLLSLTPTWLRCFVLLCGQLGLRFNEAARANPANWRQDTHTLAVIAKGGHARLLPTTPELEELFAVAARANQDPTTPFIFLLYGEPARLGPHKGELIRNPKTFLWPKWERWRKKLNINPQLTIHDLRRTRITEVYRQTLDVKLAQQFAGHQSIASTAHYLAPWDEQKVLEAIRNTAPPGGWSHARQGGRPKP